MKLLLSLSILLAIIGTATAQETFSKEEFNRKLNKTGTLCDTVYNVRIVSDTLTLLSMGGKYPDQKYTVAVKGIKINLDWANLQGKNLCVTGVFEMIKGQPEIEIAEPEQIDAKKH